LSRTDEIGLAKGGAVHWNASVKSIIYHIGPIHQLTAVSRISNSRNRERW